MLTQLVLATALASLTVLMHLVGLVLLMRALNSHARIVGRLRVFPFTTLLGATLGIIGIHSAEIWFYAAVYMLLHAFPHFEAALYYSTVTYSSIGYGDVLMPHAWRILGAIEGAVGIIMLGWSTAFLISLLVQLRMLGHDWLRHATRHRSDVET